MRSIDPKNVDSKQLHNYLLSTVVPRPIAFASTIDRAGNVNLSPFSYFNCFSTKPPVLVFSPSRRVRDNTTKHTYENVLEVEEVVINMVSYDMVEQMSLSSAEYARGVDEFVKSGLTPMPSKRVRPPRVKESPVAFECKVIEVKPLGTEGGAGNLIICEILMAHISEHLFDGSGVIDPRKLDAIGRMGGNWYCRIVEEALFQVPKPGVVPGIGIDRMPKEVKNSKVLTGNDLGRLGNIEKLPRDEGIKAFGKRDEIKAIINEPDRAIREKRLHLLAQKYLNKQDLESAWKVLLQ